MSLIWTTVLSMSLSGTAYFAFVFRRADYEEQARQKVAVLYLADCAAAPPVAFRAGGRPDGASLSGIVLPCADVQERKFCYMVMHELTHYKRRDILYKWLVQLTVCLHWFNPFIYWMCREIERACEFSCDEAVVSQMGYDHAADYGETLLDVMAAAGIGKEPFAAVTMSANKELLRERLGAIMSCKKKTKMTGIITIGLTMCVALGAFFLGVYPAAAAEPESAEAGVLSAMDKAAGAVNVKIIRAEDGQITGAAYMTEAEIEELFEDMKEDAESFPQEMTVAMPVCRIREGAGGELVVGLIGEGEIVTVLGKEEGKDGQMWYLLDKESLSEQPVDSVEECYIRADLLRR